IKLDNQDLKTVGGVVQDPPASSSFQFGYVSTFNPSSDFVQQASSDWQNCFTQTFVEVQPGTDIDALNKKITAFANSKLDKVKFEYFLFPMDKWRLYGDFKNGVNTGGMISYVKLFTIIAVIILLIACVNFMNLSTAKSEKRAKEVGIRKTLGSERKQLVVQFYSESLIFSLGSFLFSILTVYALLPLFNTMVAKELSLHLFDPKFLALGITMILLTGLLAGSYPALYLSSFNPIRVLKGSFLPGRSAALPRKVLVVFQFGISVLLISSTILIYQQIQHVKNRDLGYNPDNLLAIPSSADANKNVDVIRNELLQTNLVASLTRTSSPVTELWNFTPAPDWKGKPSDANIIMTAMRTDAGFATTVGARLLKGRDFTNQPVDSNAMMLNRAAVEIMQLKDPIGMQMRYGSRTYNVIGVTDNVVMGSPYAAVQPMMMLYGN
ncbi:MAG: FtsX-like permease family protein, partial [Chitinophagaceae bacterium]